MAAGEVVDASLAALPKRKLFVVPGAKYQAVVAVMTRLPIAVRLWMEGYSPHTRSRLAR
jgi:hypothetical protein